MDPMDQSGYPGIQDINPTNMIETLAPLNQWLKYEWVISDGPDNSDECQIRPRF